MALIPEKHDPTKKVYYLKANFMAKKKRRISTRRLNCDMSSLRLKFCSSTSTALILVSEYGLQVPDNNKKEEDDGTNVCIAMVVFHCCVYPFKN